MEPTLGNTVLNLHLPTALGEPSSVMERIFFPQMKTSSLNPGCVCLWVCVPVCVFFLFQIFEEEHSVLYLDQGGVLVAMKHTSLPIRHLW